MVSFKKPLPLFLFYKKTLTLLKTLTMKLNSPQSEIYGNEQYTALEAQRLAHEIAFGPIVFQISRLMIKFGIFQMLSDNNKTGLSLEEIKEKSKLSKYAAQILLESSLTIGSVLLKDEKFYLAKTGWFLLNDKMARVNIDFNHDVNYLGMFNLEEALINGKPEGLKVFGNWPTIYEGLSSLPAQVQKSWFGFDHFYSDNSFEEALNIVFSKNTKTLLDVGGNTGRWALQCVGHSEEVNVTIMDLPQQIGLMRNAVKGLKGEDRIHGHAGNLLDNNVPFPKGFEAIWMSQFLDCFSEKEIISILMRCQNALSENGRVFILEPFWDRQRFETASFCLQQTSLYFTSMANGNSQMYHSGTFLDCVRKAGFDVEEEINDLGLSHTLLKLKKSKLN